MTAEPRPIGRAIAALRTQWRELGGFGRIALLGLGLSLAIAIVLTFVIPSLVRHNLIDARADTFIGVTHELVAQGLIPAADASQLDELDEAIRLRLLGGDVVRVKLWDRSGTVLYSDAEGLVGRTFPMSANLTEAFGGGVRIATADSSSNENEFEGGMGPLTEYYLPVRSSDIEVTAVFEVYEDASALNATVASTRWIVWLSVGIGLAVLGAFLASLTVANNRVINRRAREAEDLLRRLTVAQETERTRIIGALHDDVGQPLYRILYGIQGAASQVDPDSAAADELSLLASLVRSVDDTLRTELRLLGHSPIEQLDLDSLLRELVAKNAAEIDTDLTLEIGEHEPLSLAPREALFRAAREGLTNARKHSAASSVTIRLYDGNRRVILDVEDDGHGSDRPPGLGLTTTRERLEAIGGGMQLVSRNGSGTLFRAWVPAKRVARTP